MNVIERRFTPTKLELRVGANEDSGVLWGRAAAFNKYSFDLGGFRERLAPGAFTRALQDPSIGDCYLAQEHNPALILGRVRAGNLKLSQNDDGLYFNCQLPDTQVAQDVRELVKNGILSECSFAFMVPDGGDDWDDEDVDPTQLPDYSSLRDANGDLYADRVQNNPSLGKLRMRCKVRTVRSVMPLLDVSCVASPAYGGGATNAAARNIFPQGIPVSVRSNVPDLAALESFQRQQRRKLTNFILG